MDKRNMYQVGENGEGKPVILIRRKPSQIPAHIDRKLGQLAGVSHMDGPNSMVTYEFLLPENLPEALAYLKGTMWEKDATPVEKTFLIRDGVMGYGPRIMIPTYIGVSREVRAKLNELSAWGGCTSNNPNEYLMWEFPISKDINFVSAYNVLTGAGYKRVGSLFG